LDERTDRILVAASRGGDREAYAALVRRYYKHVFAVCYGVLGNAADAEDIAQDTMLAGYLKIGSLRKGECFEQWVLQIARNLCIDLIRRKKHVKVILAEHKAADPTRSPDSRDLQAVIRRLPLELRLPLVMYYFDNKSTKSIAERFKISHSSVCGRIRQARIQLHKWLTGGTDNESEL
jgi:RNA polymerase sigma-70 factor (ECF subfamily)